METIAKIILGILHSEITSMVVVVGVVMALGFVLHWGLVSATEHATGVAHNPVITKIQNGFKNYWARVKEGRDMCRACQVDGHVQCGRENWTGANTETLTCSCCVESDSWSRETENFWKEIKAFGFLSQLHYLEDMVKDIEGLDVGLNSQTMEWVIVEH